MSYLRLRALSLALLFPGAAHIDAAPSDAYPFHWSTVVNNGDFMPTDACDPLDPEAASPPCPAGSTVTTSPRSTPTDWW